MCSHLIKKRLQCLLFLSISLRSLSMIVASKSSVSSFLSGILVLFCFWVLCLLLYSDCLVSKHIVPDSLKILPMVLVFCLGAHFLSEVRSCSILELPSSRQSDCDVSLHGPLNSSIALLCFLSELIVHHCSLA